MDFNPRVRSCRDLELILGDFGPVSARSARHSLSPLCIIVATEREAKSRMRTGILTHASLDRIAVFIQREAEM